MFHNKKTDNMEPHDEHTFYMWLTIIAVVCIAAFIGALIDRYRFARAHRALMTERRREACLEKRPHDLKRL